MPEERWIAALAHGRYLVEPADEGAPLLVGFHGYGENAERHLTQLRRIPGIGAWTVCAVAALHPFYNHRTNEVIASWMTSQGRDLAIGDNVRYAASVVAAVRRRYRTSNLLVYAGFSQGVAMAYRAAAHGGYAARGLLALAGDVPPELRAARPALPPVLLGRGRGDAWYGEEKMEKDLEVLGELGARVETCVFDGGHDWHGDYFERAGAFLNELRAAG